MDMDVVGGVCTSGSEGLCIVLSSVGAKQIFDSMEWYLFFKSFFFLLMFVVVVVVLLLRLQHLVAFQMKEYHA